jgi:carboxypeptidase C (cathepsin A)
MSKLNIRVLTLFSLAALAFAVSAQAATAPSADAAPLLPAQTAPAKSQPKLVHVKTTKRTHHLRRASVQKHHGGKVVRHRHHA